MGADGAAGICAARTGGGARTSVGRGAASRETGATSAGGAGCRANRRTVSFSSSISLLSRTRRPFSVHQTTATKIAKIHSMAPPGVLSWGTRVAHHQYTAHLETSGVRDRAL